MTTQKNTPVPAISPKFENPFLGASPFGIRPDPFGPAAPLFAVSDEAPEDAPEGSYAYRLVQSGPAVPADECEVPVSSIELVIRWGTAVLHVAHLTPPRSFYVGESADKEARCDFFLPAEKLGATRLPVLLVEDGAVRVVLAPHAGGSLALDGGAAKPIADLIASGAAEACVELAGAYTVALPPGSKASVEIGGVMFEISAGNAGRAVAGRFNLDGRSLPYTALSLVVHASLLAATAFFMPPLAMADEGGISDEQRYLLMATMESIAEREPEKKDEPALTDSAIKDNNAGGTGAAAKFESGKMGSFTSANTNGRFGIQGPKDNPDVRLGKSAALNDAATFGVIGLINSGMSGDPNAPTAPWGDVASGNDPRSALGNMWGDTIAEAGGVGGLGLTGIGDGGGGLFEGVGVGHVGTVGHGAGLGDGQDFGNGHGRMARGHAAAAPAVVRIGKVDANGHIPPEVIQRIVRQNFGRFKVCYENGLRNNPNLQGRVAVRFVINREGAIGTAQNGGSDLPDSGVVSCVVRAFYGLSFPPPDSGIVTVTYPIVFAPG